MARYRGGPPAGFDPGGGDDDDSGGGGSPGGSSPPPSDIGGPGDDDDSGGGGSPGGSSPPPSDIGGPGDDDSGGSPGGSSPPPSDVGGPGDDDSGGGGSPGGSSPPPSDVGGPETIEETTTVGGGTAPPPATGGVGGGFDIEPINAGAPFTGAALVADAARDIQRSDPVGEFREFQRETTPVEDAGRQTRNFLGLPSEAEAAATTNQAIADTAGTSPRQARLDARSAALRGVDEGVDTAVDAVPGDERGVAAGATALAVAEPTPFGEAALFGASAAAGLGGSTLTDPDQGSELVPASPFGGAEIDAPTEPGRPREVDAPARPQGSRPEIDAPSDADVGVDSELDVGDGTGTDAGIQLGSQGVVLDEDGDSDAPTISREDLVEDRGAPEQDPPSTRERQRRDDLDVFERDFPGRENQVIGRDTGTEFVSDPVSGQGVDPTTGAPTDIGAGSGSPTPPLVADAGPDQAADTFGGVDLETGFTPGSDTDTSPTQEPTPTQDSPPATDTPPTTNTTPDTDTTPDTTPGSGTATGTTNAIETAFIEASTTLEGADATGFGEPNLNAQPQQPATAAPAVTSPSTGRPRRRRPRVPDTDREPQTPAFETLVTEGETVTNPTQSLSAVDEDLQEVFDDPGGP
jgi:hypothetical protein